MSPFLTGLKAEVGRKSSPRKMTLSDPEMRDFGTCVNATVGATSHSPITSVAVPTIYTIFRHGEFELMDSLGIQLKQVLHAEQVYEMHHPLSPSEEIHFTTTLASVAEKTSKTAKMAFMMFETEFVRTGDGVTVATARSTMVYRELLA
jgi:hypothetical protein